MASSIAQFRRLRGKSLHEIGVRGRQEFAKLNERILGAGASEMADDALLGEINRGSRNGNGEGPAMLILERIRSSATSVISHKTTPVPFFASLACRNETAAIIKQRFPNERQAILEYAEKAIRGRFDLLGFTDLSFGDPIDWHLDPTTGKRAPLAHWSKIDYLDPNVAGDKKVTWELNRHSHFVTLGQAYWLTGDERFAEAFVSQASSWMDANPPKTGINWASSLELSFRVIAWLWALHLFAESDHLVSTFVSRFFKYLVAQGRHIESYLSHYFSPNTHLTGEALGLFYLGAALPELARAKHWRVAGLGVLLNQLSKHIRPDGVYFEQSSYYQRYTADFYTHLILLAGAANVKLPFEVEERLTLAFEHLMWITRPDGTSSCYGDDDGGRLIRLNARQADDFRDTLAAGAVLMGRGDWKFVAGEAAIETLWLGGPAALSRYDQIEAAAPRENSRAFNEGGCYVMRDGWSDRSSYVLADCGPHGSATGAHGHADALAFEYALDGKTWLVDPGTFTYTANASLRDQFRTTEAHNTAIVDGRPQSVPAGPFGWEHTARSTAKEFISERAFDYFEGSHDGYERLDDPVTHTRSLLFVKQSPVFESSPLLFVRDQFDAGHRHGYALRYHLAPGASVVPGENNVRAFDAVGNALSISVFGQSEQKTRIEDGWVSQCYGQCEPAPVAVFESAGERLHELVSVIAPCAGAWSTPPVIEETRATRQDVVTLEDGSYGAYSIRSGDLHDVVLMGERAAPIRHGLLTAAGSIAWARFIGGEYAGGCLIGGSRFEVDQCAGLVSPQTFRWGALEINRGRIEITIHGATLFDLCFYKPQTSIQVNNRSFEIASGSRSAQFAFEGSGWKLVGQD